MSLVKTCDKPCSNENKILNNWKSCIMKGEGRREAQQPLRWMHKIYLECGNHVGWGETGLFLVLIMWVVMLIFLLWYVKKRRNRHFRKAAHQKILVSAELPAQMEWIPWPKGGFEWLAASLNTCTWWSEGTLHFIAVFMGVPNVSTA